MSEPRRVRPVVFLSQDDIPAPVFVTNPDGQPLSVLPEPDLDDANDIPELDDIIPIIPEDPTAVVETPAPTAPKGSRKAAPA